MSVTLKKSRLDALYEHIKNDGANDPETVADVLGIDADDTETMDAYIARLQERNPELFGDAPESAPEPEPEPEPKSFMATKSQPVPTIQIRNDDGLVEELEILSHKGDFSQILVRRKVPTDRVDIVVKGKIVTVDILKLRKLPAEQVVEPFGLTAATLLMLASAAKV